MSEISLTDQVNAIMKMPHGRLESVIRNLHLAKNQILAEKLCHEIINLTDEDLAELKDALVESPVITLYPPIIERLAQDDDEITRASIAVNPVLKDYPDIAKTLAASNDKYVMEALAENPALQVLPEIVEILTQSENEQVLKNLARNSALKYYPDILKKFAENNDPYIQYIDRFLAANEALENHAEIVEQFSKDEDARVVINLSQNSALEKFPDIMASLARHPNVRVRIGLAENPAVRASAEAVKILAQQIDVQNVDSDTPTPAELLCLNPALAYHPDVFRALADENTDAFYKARIFENLAATSVLPQFPDIALKLFKNIPEARDIIIERMDDFDRTTKSIFENTINAENTAISQLEFDPQIGQAI